MKLINDSLTFDFGVFIMFASHIWMDYAWLILTAYATKRGISMLNSRYYRYLLIILNVIMVYFGINFIITSL